MIICIGLMGIREELHRPAYVRPSNAPLVSLPLAPCIPGDAESVRQFVRSTLSIAVVSGVVVIIPDGGSDRHKRVNCTERLNAEKRAELAHGAGVWSSVGQI